MRTATYVNSSTRGTGKHTRSMGKPIKDKFKITKFKPSLQFYESKFGWLLLSDVYKQPRKLVFYSPFLEEKNSFIDLPLLKSSGISFATFTSNPLDDKDCTVVALGTNHRNNTLHIYTYRRGHNSWDSQVSKCEFLLWNVESWTYSEGIFYYVTVNGTVGKFDSAQEAWNVFPSLPTIIHRVPDLQYRMVKSDGEVFLILQCNLSRAKYQCWCNYAHHIYKLDLSSMIWEDLKSIGDRVLFIGIGYNSVLNASVLKLNGERKGISDKIYYSSHYKLKYCTVHDYTLGNCNNGKPRKLDCSRHYGSIAKKERCIKLLIDPPPR